jgi:hypothetical protein
MLAIHFELFNGSLKCTPIIKNLVHNSSWIALIHVVRSRPPIMIMRSSEFIPGEGWKAKLYLHVKKILTIGKVLILWRNHQMEHIMVTKSRLGSVPPIRLISIVDTFIHCASLTIQWSHIMCHPINLFRSSIKYSNISNFQRFTSFGMCTSLQMNLGH